MKFTIHKKTLVKMLKVISGGSIKKDAHLRIAAQDGRVTLTTEDLNEASYDAEVIAERVCFFRHKQLLPLLTSYKSEQDLTMQITADGIDIGSNQLPHAGPEFVDLAEEVKKPGGIGFVAEGTVLFRMLGNGLNTCFR